MEPPPPTSGSSCPPTTRRENLEPVVEATRAAAARAAAGSWSSTTTRPTAPGEIADRLAAESDDLDVLHRPEKEGLGPAYVAGFHHALDARRAPRGPDGRRLLARPGRHPARCSRPRPKRDVVIGSRYVDGGERRRTGACCGERSAGWAAPTLAACLGVRDPRSDRRLQGDPPRGAGGDRPRARSPRSAMRFRSRSPTARSAPGFRVVEVPIHVSRPAGGEVEDDGRDRRSRPPRSASDADAQSGETNLRPRGTSLCIVRAR